MDKRFVAIWFRHLLTDYFTLKKPALRDQPFVLISASHGRMVITAANALAESKGVFPGMVLADARAIMPGLLHEDEPAGLKEKLLNKIAEWCIRFTPVVAVDRSYGLILDASGCPHLWGGDSYYMTAIAQKLKAKGFQVRMAMAGTIGAAWALSRYGEQSLLAEFGKELEALLPLPPAALRLEAATVDTLHKLGLRQTGQFIQMPREIMRRRFGANFLLRLDQALGNTEEMIEPVQPQEPYSERLPCIEPIVTAVGIETGLQQLLDALCGRLQAEEKGLRKAIFKAYRIDGKLQELVIQTRHPSNNQQHIFKLFKNNIDTLEPDLGFELFSLTAAGVEDHAPAQAILWNCHNGLADTRLAELIDHLSFRLGADAVERFLPAEHNWPERSVKRAQSLLEKPATGWNTDQPRPIWIERPIMIQVTAPVPDYPPMNFRYKGKLHTVKKADGPERIEQEWWLQTGKHRDYYIVEDENALRFWIFRQGHYNETEPVQWFLHGFFA